MGEDFGARQREVCEANLFPDRRKSERVRWKKWSSSVNPRWREEYRKLVRKYGLEEAEDEVRVSSSQK